MRAEKAEEAQVAYIYYGSFQGGWQAFSVAIGPEETRIHVAQPKDIVEKYASKRLMFVDGLALLNKRSYISADLVHPTAEGIEEIVNNRYLIMKKGLGEK